MDKNTRVEYSSGVSFRTLSQIDWDNKMAIAAFVVPICETLVEGTEDKYFDMIYKNDSQLVKEYVEKSKEDSAYLMGCYLFNAIKEATNISEKELDNWIKKNANSINLASSYLNNIEAAIRDIKGDTKEEVKEEPKEIEEKASEPKEEEKAKEASVPLSSPMSFGDINDIQCRLISTNSDGTNNVEFLDGVKGTVESNEFYSINGIDYIKYPAFDRVLKQWQAAQDPSKDKLISNLIKGFDNKLGTLNFQAIDPKTFTGALTIGSSGETLVFTVDKGGRIQKNENKIIINLFGKDYIINAEEKNFLNSLAKGEIQQEYLEKIDLYGDDIKTVAAKVNLLEVPKNLMGPICKNIVNDKESLDRIYKNPYEKFEIKTFSSKDKFIIDSPICKIIFDQGKSLIDDKQLSA